jgi:hypothetical protein
LSKVSLHVVLPIPENIQASVGPGAVSLPKNIGGYKIHILPVLGLVLLVLVRVDHFILINWFLDTIDGDEVHIESDVEQLIELLLRLVLQVELPLVIALTVSGMLVLMPSVAFESVE